MKNILDALNGNGGLKAGLGNVGDTLKNTLQNVGAGSPGGIGGLLGSAALGGLLGALFTGKSAKKFAKGALMVGGLRTPCPRPRTRPCFCWRPWSLRRGLTAILTERKDPASRTRRPHSFPIRA